MLICWGCVVVAMGVELKQLRSRPPLEWSVSDIGFKGQQVSGREKRWQQPSRIAAGWSAATAPAPATTAWSQTLPSTRGESEEGMLHRTLVSVIFSRP